MAPPARPVLALVRPESVQLQPDPAGDARVLSVSFLGSLCRVQVQLADGELIAAQLSAAESTGLAVGGAVRVSVLPAPVFAVPRDPTA